MTLLDDVRALPPGRRARSATGWNTQPWNCYVTETAYRALEERLALAVRVIREQAQLHEPRLHEVADALEIK
ncbi:MAG: hypothetical protein V4457_06105 [Pseudomonadota bacterium]